MAGIVQHSGTTPWEIYSIFRVEERAGASIEARSRIVFDCQVMYEVYIASLAALA